MHVEIWSDIACPWCYVGKRRFEVALEGFEHADAVEVTWRSFELDPGAPPAWDVDGATHLAQKYGASRDQALAMMSQMADTAAMHRLDFDFERQRGGSTFDAHRLVHLAKGHDRQDAMKERLFKAYLEEGELMSDHATLRRLAAEVGLPDDEVVELLAGDRFAADVRKDERTGAQLGISAVPFFVIDRAIGASGAQLPAVLRGLLEQGWARREPIIGVLAAGEACGREGC